MKEHKKTMCEISLEHKLELRQILRLKFEQYLIWYFQTLQFPESVVLRSRYLKAATEIAHVFGTFCGEHMQKQLEPHFQSLLLQQNKTTLPTLVHLIHLLHPTVFQKDDVQQAFSGFVELAEKLSQTRFDPAHGPTQESIDRFDRIQTYTARVADFIALRLIRACAISSRRV